MRCPTCKNIIPEDQPRVGAFCSSRCKLLDLGKWLDGSYAIPGEPATDEELTEDLNGDVDLSKRR